ncbi:hypothetical protein EJB05_20153, partial [Eragrostis curvula]
MTTFPLNVSFVTDAENTQVDKDTTDLLRVLALQYLLDHRHLIGKLRPVNPCRMGTLRSATCSRCSVECSCKWNSYFTKIEFLGMQPVDIV